jgi:hypothetical protein
VVAALILAVRPPSDVPERSIVVLPFVNLSADPDNEYFSDGLTEEIITRLAAVTGLKVISRTSAMHYKGTTMALPEIAKELGVDHILEAACGRAAAGSASRRSSSMPGTTHTSGPRTSNTASMTAWACRIRSPSA